MSETISFLLESAARAPLLNATQEIELARQVRAWLDDPNPDAKVVRRGKKAKDRMIQSNMRLVIHNAKKYQKRIASNPALSLEDLIQEGMFGVNRAVEKFDPERGYKFSTYCTLWIKQSIGRLCDVNASVMRITPQVHHIALKWSYRPEGQTLEEFAAERNREPEWIKQQLSLWQRAQVKSLDAKTQVDDDGSDSLLNLIASDSPIEDEQGYAQILDDLKYLDGGVLKESLAVLELAEECKPAEIAELMGWSRAVVHRKLNDCRSQIREHLPEHIRDAIVGPERKIEPAIIDASPSPKLQPARELVLAHASVSTVDSTMTSSIQPTTNGHSKSLEAEAMEIIETVKAEPVAEAPKPKRGRRTKAEVQAEKQSALISVVVDGTQFAGQPDHIARLLVAMKAA